MKKYLSPHLGMIITLTAMVYLVYYLLLKDTVLHTSISAIIAQCHHLEIKKHLLVLGLLPIYIASMVFGAALLGIYLGSIVQQIIVTMLKKTSLTANSCAD